MKVEQYVMAYEVEQDRLRAILPNGFVSLRPVLRINSEIRYGETESVYIEFNTAVEADGRRGWLNIGSWDNAGSVFSYKRSGKAGTFTAPFLDITYTGVGVEGGCPAEKDNEGCFFLGKHTILRPAEKINSSKEFCDCEFRWKFTRNDAHGVSMGKTLPAFAAVPKIVYDRHEFTAQSAAAIPCEQVLGSYVVKFERQL